MIYESPFFISTIYLSLFPKLLVKYLCFCDVKYPIIQVGNLNSSSFTLYILATFQVSATGLPTIRIVDLLRNLPDDGGRTLPSVKLKGGEIYIYKPKSDTEKGEI